MKYELQVVDDSQIKIKKVMSVPLWNSNQIFDDLQSLQMYLRDYVDLPVTINQAFDQINIAPMNEWVEFA